jgi:hypothetical protein
MSRKKMKLKSQSGISRRDFIRGMALATATATIPYTACTKIEKTTTAPTQTPGTQSSHLSSAAEAQVQTILSKYGNRFSEEQKAEVRRVVGQVQGISDTLRAFKLENSNEPSMIFHVYRSGGR